MNRAIFILLFLPFITQVVDAQNITAKDYSQLPIKPARTISFTTDEGSYMDVDVSPDGKTLLFSLLGDLYSLPATGGTAKQLTRGLAINRCPVGLLMESI